MKDFIIVGRGLAAITLAHTFFKEGISFHLVGTQSLSSCSRVAAGIWNPIVFKRLTKSWMADDLVPCLNQFYSECESRLSVKLITQRPIIKPFSEDQEKKLWLKKAEGELAQFLEALIHEEIPTDLNQCKIPMGYAKVLQAGNLDMVTFLDHSSRFFESHISDEVFDHKALRIENEIVLYKTLEAKNIVFCEGHLVKNNPYFDWIPLKPAKGEVFTIQSNELAFTNSIFNKNGFIMDLVASTYKVGATYAWSDLTESETEEAHEELKQKLSQMISCNYTILKHQSGIRPSSIDRRPIIGNHPKYKSFYVFNGLGTKGVMLAPYFAKKFVNFYLQREDLDKEVNLQRFYHLYATKEQS